MHQTQWSAERPLPPPVSLTSQSHHEKPPEVTCTSRGTPGCPASTRERPRETFFNTEGVAQDQSGAQAGRTKPGAGNCGGVLWVFHMLIPLLSDFILALKLNDDFRTRQGATELFDGSLKHISNVDGRADLGGDLANDALSFGPALRIIVQASAFQRSAQLVG